MARLFFYGYSRFGLCSARKVYAVCGKVYAACGKVYAACGKALVVKEREELLPHRSPPKPEAELTTEERYQRGMELFKAGSYEDAFHMLLKVCPITKLLGQDGYADAQTALARMYETG